MTSPTRDEVRAAVERLVAEISIVYAADDPVMHDLRTLIAAAEDGARDAITPVSAQTPAGEDWGSHPLSGLHRSRESFDGAADAYEREYWSEQLQRKADADKARGALQPVSYYVADAIGRLQAQQRAAPPAQPSKVVAALQAELKWFRRKLCAVYAGPLAYMEDGEAQDARAHPIIDFLRDSPESIEAAMMKRAVAELGEGRS